MVKFLRNLLILLFIMQVLISAGFELAHDEAYYWLYSKNLAWGYFDHPPGVGIVIKVFSFLPTSEWSVRLGFIILQFLTLGLIFRLLPKKDYTKAAVLFFAFPLASLTGFLALPDIPLLFMSALYCFQLKRFLEKKDLAQSLLLALVIAALLYSKYHGILLVFFTIVAIPKLVKEKLFYLVAIASILLFLPHVWWEYAHDFSTLRYHFLERPSSSFSMKRVVEYIGIQIALAGVLAGPMVWWVVLREKTQDDFSRAMKFIGIGTVAFFLISSFSKRVEANWTIFIAPSLIYLVAQSEIWERGLWKGLLYTSFAIVVVARLAFILPVDSIGIKRQREFHGWEDWALEMASRCGEGHLMANSYQIASKLSFYLQKEVHALNYHSRKNQFDYWHFDKKLPEEKICYITDKQEFTGIEVKTPEEKKLIFVTNKSLKELQTLKGEI